jgi:hypothetical protein
MCENIVADCLAVYAKWFGLEGWLDSWILTEPRAYGSSSRIDGHLTIWRCWRASNPLAPSIIPDGSPHWEQRQSLRICAS